MKTFFANERRGHMETNFIAPLSEHLCKLWDSYVPFTNITYTRDKGGLFRFEFWFMVHIPGYPVAVAYDEMFKLDEIAPMSTDDLKDYLERTVAKATDHLSLQIEQIREETINDRIATADNDSLRS